MVHVCPYGHLCDNKYVCVCVKNEATHSFNTAVSISQDWWMIRQFHDWLLAEMSAAVPQIIEHCAVLQYCSTAAQLCASVMDTEDSA